MFQFEGKIKSHNVFVLKLVGKYITFCDLKIVGYTVCIRQQNNSLSFNMGSNKNTFDLLYRLLYFGSCLLVEYCARLSKDKMTNG